MFSVDPRSKTTVSESFSSYFKDLFVKKRKLVKLELDFLPQVKAEWETILGDKITDRRKAETTIKACYQKIGLNPPSILWADHPINVIKLLLDRSDLNDISGKIANQIWNQSELAIQAQIDPTATAYILEHVSPNHIIKTPSGKHKIPSIADRLNELMWGQLNELYADLTNGTMPNSLQDYRIGDLSYFDYFLRIGVEIPQVQLAIDLAQSCGWVWTFEKVAILTPKPAKVKIDRQGKIVAIIYDGVNVVGCDK